ncbi:hypothetical protein [Chitinophaga barathri]|uniref:Uncharacterized protein n=1 Tax=Chitinophaga barathri TaxID=1647451 RepID=A0A3N4MGU6_9BACT|nr:hypothetical protein [Chitinophaga barathri]RPD43091.1 hypothetical protein EG028_02010 [Chitinophaga barathri]
MTPRPVYSESGLCTSFAHLLLRKGYEGQFCIEVFDQQLSTGAIEQCMSTIESLLQTDETATATFFLVTDLPARTGSTVRRCRLQVTYSHADSYHIKSVLLTEPGLSHLIPITSNDNLPFFRMLQTMMLPQRRWTRQLAAWFNNLTAKKISP